MVKQFFKQLLSSFMGAWIALVLFGAVVVVILISMFASIGVGNVEQVKSNSILCLNLEGTIEETETAQPLSYQTFLNRNAEPPQILNRLVAGLAEGAANKDVSALFIKCGGIDAAPATLHALREAVKEFKKSKKPVYAYGDAISQGDYYIACLADSVYLNPMGSVLLQGLGGTSLYFKDLFDKLGVSFQVFKVGTYKSAVEPYLYNEMSEPARAQLDTLFGNMWKTIKGEIAASRKMQPAQIDSLVNKVVGVRDAQYSLKAGLVDRLVTRRVMKNILADKVGVEVKNLNVISPETLADQTGVYDDYNADKQVAILYASGEIMEGSENGINCEKLVPVITRLAEEKKVRAMVLRVNSPGGSVFGSAEIGEALKYFQSCGKPIVVSMSDYAASGGYWISCEANKIIADPLTITGSIGIFGLYPELSGTAAKIGVTPQTVRTNPNGGISILTPLTPDQSQAIQQNIEHMYRVFVDRVAKGRKMPFAKVESMAQGRVWDAATAVNLGLVDRLGTLSDAIDLAADLAKIKGQHSVAAYPEPSSSMWAIINSFNEAPSYHVIASILGPGADPKTISMIHTMLNRRTELALFPSVIFNF